MPCIDTAVIDEYATTIGPAGVALYGAIARHADREGQAFPSFQRLQTLFGMSSTTVARSLLVLEEVGLIRRTRRTSANGSKRRTLYELLPMTVPFVQTKAPPPPDEAERGRAVKRGRSKVSSGYARILLRLGRRDGFHCQRCQTTCDLTIDHRRPLRHGGTNDDDHRQLLCTSCHAAKGARTGEWGAPPGGDEP